MYITPDKQLSAEKKLSPKPFRKPRREKDTITNPTFECTVDANAMEKVRYFKVNLLGGNLNILESSDGTARCRVQWRSDIPEKHQPKFHFENETLYLKATSLKPFIGQKHAYIIEVYLPSHLDVNIRMFAGVIYLENVRGALMVSLKAGDLSGYAHSQVHATVGAGNIQLHGLENDVYARVSLGDVNVVFDKMERVKQVELSTFMGDVRGHFPSGFFPNSHRWIKKKGRIQNMLDVDLKVHFGLGGASLDDLDLVEKNSTNSN
jgi:hypothetical protein